MILQTPAGIPLDIYYKTPPGINLEDQPLIEGEKLGLSPYTCGETFYWEAFSVTGNGSWNYFVNVRIQRI